MLNFLRCFLIWGCVGTVKLKKHYNFSCKEVYAITNWDRSVFFAPIDVSMVYVCECLLKSTKYVSSVQRFAPIRVFIKHAPDHVWCNNYIHWHILLTLINIHTIYCWNINGCNKRSPISISYWVSTMPLWLIDRNCFGLGLSLCLLTCLMKCIVTVWWNFFTW